MGVRDDSKDSYDPVEEILKAYCKWKKVPSEDLTNSDRSAAVVAHKHDEQVLRQATVMRRQWKNPTK